MVANLHARKKKGSVALTLFTRIMLIFIVVAIIAMIWIYIGKVQEVKRISEQVEKEKTVWQNFMSYGPIRVVSDFGYMSYLYDFDKLNNLSMYQTLDCTFDSSLSGFEKIPNDMCINIYPNKYRINYVFDSPPENLVDDTDQMKYLEGVFLRCDDYYRSYLNKTFNCVDFSNQPRCLILKDVVDLFDEYKGTEMYDEDGEYNVDYAEYFVEIIDEKMIELEKIVFDGFIDLNLEDITDDLEKEIEDVLSEVNAEKYLYCSKSFRGMLYEWQFGSDDVDVKFREMIGIKVDDRVYIGMIEGGVELLA
jgi:hypothetical protein